MNAKAMASAASISEASVMGRHVTLQWTVIAYGASVEAGLLKRSSRVMSDATPATAVATMSAARWLDSTRAIPQRLHCRSGRRANDCRSPAHRR